jgi:putative membrane protein
MKKLIYFTFIAGLSLFIVIMIREGISEIFAALTVAGWGIVLIAIYRAVPMLFDTLGWSVLFAKTGTPSILILSWARWIGESVNTLLPVAQIGGNIVRAKIAMRHGISGTRAGAIAVVDLTTGLATQFIFALLGAFFLLRQGDAEPKISLLTTGLIVGFFVLASFYIMQRLGLFTYFIKIIRTFAQGKALISLAGSAKKLDNRIKDIYGNHTCLYRSGIWRLLAWIARTGETWLALSLLGFPVDFQKAFIIESLSSAVRISAFFIPGALGVQEGGILILGSLVGINSEIALALALIKRVRELFVGIPGLISWSLSKTHRL